MSRPVSVRLRDPDPGLAISVGIGIITYRRPGDLQRLLASLRTLDSLDPPARLAAIVVVDNDPEEGAKPLVEAEAGRSAVPVVYACEATPGISAARNRVVELAAHCRLLAFIDDDEVPSAGWLREMVSLQTRTGAQIVAGPTVSVLPQGVPEWIRKGRLFERTRARTGSTFRFAGSGNLLLDLVAVAELIPLFDLRYGLLGGSDTHLLMRAHSAKLLMLWCDEAVVYETVPMGRTTLPWIVGRAFRTGNTVALCERELPSVYSRATRMAVRSAKALVRFGQGVGESLFGLARRDLGASVAGALRSVNAAGMLAGAFGYRYAEYKRAVTRAADAKTTFGGLS